MADTTQDSDNSRKKKRGNKDDQLNNVTTGGLPVSVDPVALLKLKIEEAKAAKDFKGAQKLREHLWTYRDTGTIEPGILGDVQQLPTTQASATTTGTLTTDRVTNDVTTGHASTTDNDATTKSLHKLEKKLKAIEDLKEKRSKGIKLEANQRAKIGTEDELKKEIEMLRKIMSGEN